MKLNIIGIKLVFVIAVSFFVTGLFVAPKSASAQCVDQCVSRKNCDISVPNNPCYLQCVAECDWGRPPGLGAPPGIGDPTPPPQESIQLDTGCSALNLTNVGGLVSCSLQIMQVFVYFLISLALIFTIYAALRFIGADGTGRTEWRNMIARGFIALFVMFAIWGIVKILTTTFFGKEPPKATVNIPSLDQFTSP